MQFQVSRCWKIPVYAGYDPINQGKGRIIQNHAFHIKEAVFFIYFSFFVLKKTYITILLPKESYILYIVDSTNKHYIDNNTFFLQCLRELERNQKILIIANKQDLPGAMSTEEIAKIMGYPTIGFSATTPGASEKLERIISHLLSD